MTSRGTRYWSTGAIPLIAPDMLGDIIATASDIAIVISDMGQVLSVLINPNHDLHGRLDHWLGRDVRELLRSDSQPKVDMQLAAFAEDRGTSRPVELNHTRSSDLTFPVRYSFHRIGPDGALLMLGRDLRPIAEMQQQLVEAQLTLERDYEQQRQIGTHLRVLMETTGEAVVFISLASGRVAQANDAAAALLGRPAAEIEGTAFAQLFVDQPADMLETLADPAVGAPAPVLVARRSRRRLRLQPSVFRAAGERMMLARLNPAVESVGVSQSPTPSLSRLFDEGSDGIVFTDPDGLIVAANEAFMGMADLAQASAARGRSLAEFLGRGSVDLRVLTDAVQRQGRFRLYAARLLTSFGAELPIELSATLLADPTAPGMAFVIRDVTRSDVARPQANALGVTDDGMRSARELVGSVTLKDIVAETTDVVEKMCIETAVELTGNNRVAAAELLGLSRQSLYVKLRKYDLLARDPD